MTKQMVRALVKHKATRLVNLEQLNVDPSYQREVKKKHNKIVAEFDETALGVPLIGEREDGSLWIVDGLQRVTALKKLGWREVKAEVFHSNGPEHEALIFKLVNLNRTRLTPVEEFRSLLAAQDAVAWRIKETVEAAGYRLKLNRAGKSDSGEVAAKQLTCVSILRIVAKDCGIASISFALAMIDKAWPGDRYGSNGYLIAGLCYFYKNNDGVVDEDRLVPRLMLTTPQRILTVASTRYLGGSKWFSVGEVVAEYYRKRRGKKL